MEGEIWVYMEHDRGQILESSLKCMSEGRKLAVNLGLDLACVIINPPFEDIGSVLKDYGVDKAYIIQGIDLEGHTSYVNSLILTDLLRMHAPLVVLFAASSEGNELAARVAAKLKRGLIENCIDFEIDNEGRLLARKPFCGGKLHATLTWTKRPYIATVDTNSLTVEKAKEVKPLKVVTVELRQTFEDKVRVVDYVRADPKKINVNEAEIVITVGRGLGEARFLKMIEELADILGATIGGTRPTVDEGWIPEERKIGSSGKEISPTLHIACGVSGASHFIVGVRNSKFTIAINKDVSAPIFKIADLGVVGNLHEIIPLLIKKLRESKLKNIRLK